MEATQHHAAEVAWRTRLEFRAARAQAGSAACPPADAAAGEIVSNERQLKFKLGDLDLVLSPRLDAADFAWMASLRGRQQFTPVEANEVTDRAAALLVKCARDQAPNLAKEQVLDELPATACDRYDCMAAIGVAMLQVSGFIPTEEN